MLTFQPQIGRGYRVRALDQLLAHLSSTQPSMLTRDELAARIASASAVDGPQTRR